MRAMPLAVNVLAGLLAGCTYPAIPAPGPAPVSASAAPASHARVPGTFLLDIGQANLRRELDLDGFSCRLAHFPVDAASAFADSVRGAVAQVVERVEPAQAGASTAARASGGAISVLPGSFAAGVDSDQELLGVTFRGRAAIAANVVLDGPGGSATFAVEGSGTAQGRNAMIGSCETIAEVGREAVQAAIADLGTRLRDQLAAAPQLRPAATARPARR